MFGGNGVGFMVVVASRCDMDNWTGLVHVGNVVPKERPIDEDSSEEPIDGGIERSSREQCPRTRLEL